MYGTCTSRYERRGPVLLKSRDLKQCHESRLANFWPHSVSLDEDTVSLPLFCVKKKGLHSIKFRNVHRVVLWADSNGTHIVFLRAN